MHWSCVLFFRNRSQYLQFFQFLDFVAKKKLFCCNFSRTLQILIFPDLDFQICGRSELNFAELWTGVALWQILMKSRDWRNRGNRLLRSCSSVQVIVSEIYVVCLKSSQNSRKSISSMKSQIVFSDLWKRGTENWNCTRTWKTRNKFAPEIAIKSQQIMSPN